MQQKSNALTSITDNVQYYTYPKYPVCEDEVTPSFRDG